MKGLISLDKKNKIQNKYLIRPLLDQKKDDLIFLSKHVFNFYVQDPTNKDQKYKRIQIRNLIKRLEKDGLDKNKFKKTIQNLKNSNNTVEFYVKENLNKNTFFSQKKRQLILSKDFFKQSGEVIFRSLSDSIRLIGNKHYSPRGRKLTKITQDIENNKLFKATLGGCLIEKVNETIIITKEH